jgi:REP element-mobilizing transposase RayT
MKKSRSFILPNVIVNMHRKPFAFHRLRRHRHQLNTGVFSAAKCVQPKRPVLKQQTSDLIVSSFQFYVERGDIEVGAFVVMPDHFHVIVNLLSYLTLSAWMHNLMSFISAKTARSLRASGYCWQDGCYDTKIRSERQFNYLIEYLHYNPVAAGLVLKPEEWPPSSARSHKWFTLTW